MTRCILLGSVNLLDVLIRPVNNPELVDRLMKGLKVEARFAFVWPTIRCSSLIQQRRILNGFDLSM